MFSPPFYTPVDKVRPWARRRLGPARRRRWLPCQARMRRPIALRIYVLLYAAISVAICASLSTDSAFCCSEQWLAPERKHQKRLCRAEARQDTDFHQMAELGAVRVRVHYLVRSTPTAKSCKIPKNPIGKITVWGLSDF